MHLSTSLLGVVVPLILGFGFTLVLTLGGVLFAIAMSKKRKDIPHPSEFSSSSRAALRPLRQAAESFEELIRNNPNTEASKIIGSQASQSVLQIVARASQMAATRDQLQEMVRRAQSQGNDSTAAQAQLDQIDQQIAAATASIDALSLKITQNLQSAQPVPVLEEDSDLSDLISRLQNLNQSFDEVQQSATIEQSQ